MEGPSLVLLREELLQFKGRKITHASGTSKIDFGLIQQQKIRSIKSWGKHFLIELKSCTIRIHFLMFGSYRVNDEKEAKPRLHLQFENGDYLNFYTTAVKLLDEPLDEMYDWTADVMSDQWNPKKARKKLKALDVNVGDALLDQNIFAGVGNIIKNEVLFRIHVHPKSTIHGLPPRVLTSLINEARNYSFDFYAWKKDFVLKKHWLIYTKRKCPRCGVPVIKEYTGKTKRRSFYCTSCQTLYK